jgi:toxoflavin biosynthesis protein ToxC
MMHDGPIAGIASHGDFIATAGYDNKLILWDQKTGKAIARATHDHLVNSCAFSNNGQWLVSASSDYSARLWRLPEMRLHAVMTDHQDDVDMAVFSPDDQWIATCALDRKVRVFNLAGECRQVFSGHTGNVLSLAWTSDARHIVSTSVDGTLRTWDTVSGLEIHCTDLKVRTDSLEIDNAGVIYAGDDLGRIAIMRGQDIQFIQAHRAGIKKVALNQQTHTLVCLSYDRSMSLWDVCGQTPVLLHSTFLPDQVWARAATVLADGRVATGSFGGSYAVFDPVTQSWDLDNVNAGHALNDVITANGKIYAIGDAGQVLENGQPLAELGSLCNFLLAAPGCLLAGGQAGKLFDATTTEVLYEHHSPLNCGVYFESQGKPLIAIGSYTGEILVFSWPHDGLPVMVNSLKVYENAIKGLSFVNGVLFSVCASTDIAWHRVTDWSLLKRVSRAHDKITNDCCTIDQDHVATVSRDRTLRIWAGNKTEIYPAPHPKSIKCIGIDDGKSHLLTGCYGGTLAMFCLNTRKWTQIERPTMSGISAINWDSQQQQFLASSYDGRIYAMAVEA